MCEHPSPNTVTHYEYVFPDGHMYVYDLDNGFALIKSVALPTSGTRGAVACAQNHTLYVSYGSDGSGTGHLLAYDLMKNKLLWTRSYSHGIDSHSIAPDCQMIYMPVGELASTCDLTDARNREPSAFQNKSWLSANR